jgi:hypothetical protein
MAKQSGGLFGIVSGSVAGLTFSAARGRKGKLVTVREKVDPANPQTADQTAQRNKFTTCLDVVRAWGADVYSVWFNRAVEQLAGFQSLMSILLNAIDSALLFTPPSDTPLGDLHFPVTINLAAGGAAGEIDITWSTENGVNGTAADEVYAIACSLDQAVNQESARSLAVATRADGVAGITLADLGSNVVTMVGIWFGGVGIADGNVSYVKWGSQATHA